MNVFGTDPSNNDHDDDGALDGDEVRDGFDPKNSLSKSGRTNFVLSSTGGDGDHGEISFNTKHSLTTFTVAAWVFVDTDSEVGKGAVQLCSMKYNIAITHSGA